MRTMSICFWHLHGRSAFSDPALRCISQYETLRGLIFNTVSTIEELPVGPGIIIFAKMHAINEWTPIVVKAVRNLKTQKCNPVAFWRAALIQGMTHVHYVETNDFKTAVELANSISKHYHVGLIYW